MAKLLMTFVLEMTGVSRRGKIYYRLIKPENHMIHDCQVLSQSSITRLLKVAIKSFLHNLQASSPAVDDIIEQIKNKTSYWKVKKRKKTS